MPGPVAADIRPLRTSCRRGPRARAGTSAVCLPQGGLSALRRVCLGSQRGLLASSPGQHLSALRRASCPLLEFHRLSAVPPQGAHVTINARAEEDVEPECIMQKVARASGANYAFHKESGRFQDTGPQAPVVSAAWARGWQAGSGRWAGFSLMGLGSCLPGFQSLSQIRVQTVTPCCMEAGATPCGAGAIGHEEQAPHPAWWLHWLLGASYTPGTAQSRGHDTSVSCTVSDGGRHRGTGGGGWAGPSQSGADTRHPSSGEPSSPRHGWGMWRVSGHCW